MLISVIVAVYNIENYIARCIESIQKQSYQDLEIILVDDGSTDTAGQICDKYAAEDKRIRVLHRKNGGLSAARNSGIDIAQGEYITFVDGDDWIDSDMYEKMMKQVVEQQADLVACRYRCIYIDEVKDMSTGTVTVYRQPLEMLTQQLKEDESFLIQHAAWNKLYHKSLLKKERFPEGKWYEDVVFSAKILSELKCGVYIDSAFYNYVCEREGSIMNAGMTERIFTDLIPAYIEKETYLAQLGDRTPLRLHQFYFYKRLLLYYRELHRKQNKGLKKYKKWLVRLVKERKSTFQEVYQTEVAGKTDVVKMKLFMISPWLFRVVLALNDTIILPLRLKRMERKKC